MTFEGEHKQIALRGIERAMHNGIAQDGGMNEVVNLIPRNGSFVPYSPTEVDFDYSHYITEDTKMIRVHHTSTGDNVIVVYSEHYTILRTEEDDYGEKTIIANDVRRRAVRNIVFIGNRMDLDTNAGIEHWLWKNNEYVNQNDLDIHGNDESLLPSVSFKVSRGIYDGSKIYPSARYVKLHKNFTDEDTAIPRQDPLSSYVRELGSVGSDAMALLDSIRHMGGITGYILAAAAWRVKGSDVSHPKYVMASPVLLMGAPENYMKDGLYEDGNLSYINKPDDTRFIDMFDHSAYYGIYPDTAAENKAFDKLWNLSDSDDRDMEDMTESEHVFIEPLDENEPCVIRKYSDMPNPEGGGPIPHNSYGEVAEGSKLVFVKTQKTDIQMPALYSAKYAMYNHHGGIGTADTNAEYKAVRISHGSGNVLYFKLNSELAEKYKDEVDRLCIFISPVITPYKSNDASGVRFESDYVGDRVDEYDGFFFGNTGVSQTSTISYQIDHSVCGGSFSPVMKSNEEIREDIKNVAGLYKVAEVQLNELSQGTDENGWVKVNLSGGKLSTEKMVQHSDTMLKLSDLQPVGFTDGHIFGYNERLHVFNFTKSEVFRLPYKSLLYYGGDGQYPVTGEEHNNEYSIEVTDSNNSRIVSQFSSNINALNPLIACADPDSKSLRIARRYSGSGRYAVGRVVKNPIEIGGLFGGYIHENLRPLNVAVNNTDEANYSSYFNSDDFSPDSYARGRNEIRVSETGTTIFEIEKNYKIGHGEIIALARLSMGLSQDNYSKFPLVVFCTDGVYTLGVDSSGKYAYDQQDALSRVVCTNKNGICELDGAVLFPSEYGLQMVTMDGVKPVVLHANGQPKNMPDASKGLEIYYNAIHHEKVVELPYAISEEDFINEIQQEDTYIKYLHAINSAVIYNKHWTYSYLIELSSWSVTKLEQRFWFDDSDFPKQTFVMEYLTEGRVEFVQFNYYPVKQNVDCLLVSRPILLDTQHLKTAYRIVLRGSFEHKPYSGEKSYAGLYVFGSLDGTHWDYLNGCEKLITNNRFHDIGVETHRVSYKYLMVVFAGRLSNDSHINGSIEMTSKVKYNEKLK